MQKNSARQTAMPTKRVLSVVQQVIVSFNLPCIVEYAPKTAKTGTI